jgi:hypothetical protein
VRLVREEEEEALRGKRGEEMSAPGGCLLPCAFSHVSNVAMLNVGGGERARQRRRSVRGRKGVLLLRTITSTHTM